MYGSQLARQLYYGSPGFVRDLFSTAYGWKESRVRYGASYNEMLSTLERTRSWSLARKQEYQLQQATKFVGEASRSTPYYRAHSAYQNINANTRFNELPILSKSLVRQEIEQFVATGFSKSELRWVRTSGTTGSPLQFPITRQCFQYEHAIRAWHYRLAGVNVDKRPRLAFCAGHPVAPPRATQPPFWVHDWRNNWLLMSSYHLSSESLPLYVRELDRFHPVSLAGYPSSLVLLATAYEKYGSGALTLSALFTSSESLLPHQRNIIERTFRAKVFDYYGNTEMVAKIIECEHGSLHLLSEFSLVEILDRENAPVKPGKSGRLVCTGFLNPAFPLIRYDIGDGVTLSGETHCECGMEGILIESVDGRVEEYVVTPNGRLIGRLDHLFKDVRHTKEAQIVQTDPTSIVLRVVRDDGYDEQDEQAILREARIRLGDSMSISFEYVEAIPRAANGKFQFVVSLLEARHHHDAMNPNP